ncbi:GNAT family N-acetyltransferase [Citrobacter amalonaticus]|uniref:GNAT family N-acetyltransferase n=1 Tax=Citrobacter amalonaticus TaxID=35703 RepID=UPI00300D1353
MTPSKPCYLLDAHAIRSRIDELCEVLTDCVNHGASVSFLLPFERAKALAFWEDVAHSVERGERLVLAVDDRAGGIVGTVQLILQQPENQPHRADVAKLLVHSSARRQGLARQLMNRLERLAREQQKTRLVLDTATGSDAELFYHSCGWQKAGVIPDYALMPDGALTGTTVFYKAVE